ncbi:hypothetical protein EYF80_011996 [Liparis tanakae]|uniref:Uncharacterized protein n=1 Tax=Liparis tanakae TaxID=230148 RepID=A0A4Z2IIP5_9TELE|nr:hypothetical protein EYF80_011996 [Liparis tanakae]
MLDHVPKLQIFSLMQELPHLSWPLHIQWPGRSQLREDWMHRGVGGACSDASHTYQHSRTDPLSPTLPPPFSTSRSAFHTYARAQTAAERRATGIFLLVLEQLRNQRDSQPAEEERHVIHGGSTEEYLTHKLPIV